MSGTTARRRPRAAVTTSPGTITALLAAALVATVILGVSAAPLTASASNPTLLTYARDTWASLVAMTDEGTGLTTDGIDGQLTPGSRSGYTSTTNVGGYIWSAVAARDLGVITSAEASDRLAKTVTTLEGMPRHGASGMYWNWYRPSDGQPVADKNPDGTDKPPFASSVDNAWLAAALRVLAGAEPQLSARATALYDSMDFSVFYDPQAASARGTGLSRNGFWPFSPDECSIPGNFQTGQAAPLFYSCSAYDTTVSETRMTTYLGIAKGEVPANSFYGTLRTMSPGCDATWQEQKPHGTTRVYNGMSVYEGTYRYRGMSIVPGWGGSMFEALMPDLFVPEAEWGPKSWGLNHPLTVRAQKEHGLDDAQYGYWGFSPASDPFAGYAEYGVDELGMRDDGYHSDKERTNVSKDKADCTTGTNPTPTFGDGVVTPHASFLALAYDEQGVLDNLAGLAANFDAYGPGGFYDAIAVKSGTVAKRYLSLDQSMIMGAILNAEKDDALKSYFVDDTFQDAVRPLMQAQVFGSSAEPEAPSFTAPAAGQPLPAGPVDFAGTGEPGAIVTIGSPDAAAAPGSPLEAAGALCQATVAANGEWACRATDTDGPAEEIAISSRADDGVVTVGTPLSLTAVPTPTPTATTTPTPSPTPTPDTSSPPPSQTPAPTSGPPTATPTGTPSPSPSPTSTSTPTPTSTPLPTPAPTPTPTLTANPDPDPHPDPDPTDAAPVPLPPRTPPGALPLSVANGPAGFGGGPASADDPSVAGAPDGTSFGRFLAATGYSALLLSAAAIIGAAALVVAVLLVMHRRSPANRPDAQR